MTKPSLVKEILKSILCVFGVASGIVSTVFIGVALSQALGFHPLFGIAGLCFLVMAIAIGYGDYQGKMRDYERNHKIKN